MKSVNLMEEVEVRLHFERKSIKLDDEVIDEKKNGNPRGRKWIRVCRKQWNPGELKTTRQRNSEANSTKNKKTNVISSLAKTYTEERHIQSWRC